MDCWTFGIWGLAKRNEKCRDGYVNNGNGKFCDGEIWMTGKMGSR